jgi:hypothetical protein
MFGETEVTLSDTVKIAFGDVSKRDEGVALERAPRPCVRRNRNTGVRPEQELTGRRGNSGQWDFVDRLLVLFFARQGAYINGLMNAGV